MSNADSQVASFLQTDFWLEFKSHFGWRVARVGGDDIGAVGVLERRLPGGHALVYVPQAPAAPPSKSSFRRLVDEIHKRFPAAVLVRFDLPWSGDLQTAATDLGLRKAPVAVQPPDTVVVDLDGDDQSLLARMKSKTRYNIRLAAKRGVEARVAGIEELDSWYSLYRETATRDRIAIHRHEYYRDLFAVVRGAGDPAGATQRAIPGPADAATTIRIYFAEYDGTILAGIIVLEYDGTATYLYGASSNIRRELMAPYLCQWTAMTAARDRGNHHYDFYGIPPTPDPKHPMYGLYRFKTGFGGRVLHRLGAWDYPLAPLRYAVYRKLERGRDFYYKVMRKRYG